MCVLVQSGCLMYSNTHILIIPWENWVEILKLGHSSCPYPKRHVFHLNQFDSFYYIW